MDNLLEVRDLEVRFDLKEGTVRAVNGVTLDVGHNRSLGLVGESGCGKTTTGRCVLRLIKPTGGNVYWKMPDSSRARLAELEARYALLEEPNGGSNGH